jgi:teichuronic acid biosynthesis glycosyltransferase TuaG
MDKGAFPFTYTAYEKVDITGELQGRVFQPPLELSYAKLLRSCAIGCSTVMLDTKILGRRYLPDLPRSHDYALWLELLREGYVAKGIDEPLTVYREHSGSLSSNKLSKLKMAWHIYRNQESFNLLISSFLLTSYIIHGLRKRFI